MNKINWDSNNSSMDLWVEEKHRDYYSTRFRCKKVLFSGRSPYQYIDVIESAGHGRILLNDGIVMLSEKDEFVYHEMIAHVPLHTHPQAKKTLIIGGGDGGTAKEALKHDQIQECTLVEIDSMVVDVAKKYFPNLASSFTHPRLKLLIQDGAQYVKTTDQKFDIIFIDSTDPIGPAKVLFSTEFYKNIFNILSEDGILVAQAESPFFELSTQKTILDSLKFFFPLVFLYNYSNTVYPGGLWSFVLASKKYHPLKDFTKCRLSSMRYYNSDIHRACFAQPEFVKKELKDKV